LGGVFKPPTDELGFQVYISVYNTIFLFVGVSVAYGIVSACWGWRHAQLGSCLGKWCLWGPGGAGARGLDTLPLACTMWGLEGGPPSL